MTNLAEQMRLLREMTANDIARQGEAGAYESTMVRAGLLLDIIDLALSAPDLVEALAEAVRELDAIRRAGRAGSGTESVIENGRAALQKAKGSPS